MTDLSTTSSPGWKLPLQGLRQGAERIIPWLVLTAIPIVLLVLIDDHKVNIPFLDDWMFVEMFEKARAGTLTLHDFFLVQMEHRMAFVRLAILALHRIWPTDYTKWMMFSWVLLVLTYVNIGVLLRRTTGRPFRVWWPLLALAGLVVFSPVQYRIVLWAMMFQVACPGFFLSLALVALTSTRWPPWLRWTVGVLSATCATQTIASGILVWLLPLPLVFWGGALQGRRARLIFAGTWLAVFGVTMALYFTNLKNEVAPAFAYKQGEEETLQHDTRAFFEEPGRSVPYVLRFLGNHLARGTGFSIMDASLFLGTVSIALYAAALAYAGWHWRREELRRRMLPWLLFAAYSPATGVLVAMGRLWASKFGDNAIAARYVIHAVPLTVSLIALSWIVFHDIRERRSSRPFGSWQVWVLPCAAVAFLAIQVVSWQHGRRLMEIWHSSRLRGATNTLFFNSLRALEDTVPANRDLARRADKLGLLDPPMVKDNRLDNFKVSKDMISKNTAAWTQFTLEDEGDEVYCVANGYACLLGRKRVADGVFLCYKDPNAEGPWFIFHVAQVSAMPLVLKDTLGRDLQFVHTPGELQKDALSGFTSRFSLKLLPQGVLHASAWAFDHQSHRVYPIQGYYEIDTINKTISVLGGHPKSGKPGRHIERAKDKAPDRKYDPD